MINKTHKRTVRSFVCRNTKLPPIKEQLFETLWPIYGVKDWQSMKEISPAALFAKSAEFNLDRPVAPVAPVDPVESITPVILEIGFGTGDALFEMAKNYPEYNFIGVEVYRRGIVSLLSNLEEYPLHNLKLFWGDANEVLQRIENAALSRVQIFFPDPWPKSRHHKRRLIQPQFVMDLAPKLIDGGILHLATDWQDYAQHMMKVLSAEPQFVNTQGQVQPAEQQTPQHVTSQQFTPRPEYRSETKYERRGTRLGHITRDLIFKRI